MTNIRRQQTAKMLKLSISDKAPSAGFLFLTFIYFENEKHKQN